MRIVYLGSGEFGLPSLGALLERHEVRAVVTQPDRPAGRGGRLTPTPVGEFIAAIRPDVPLYKPEDVNDPALTSQLRSLDADAWVVIAFGQKLGPALLDGIFAINLHGSILPRWRGAAPVNWTILAGDAEAGSTVITLAQRMDAGLILAHSRAPLDPAMTAGDLHDALAAEGPGLVLEVLERHNAGTLAHRTQDESLVTRARKLSRADSWIDFAAGAEECRRRVQGLSPWPGVVAELRGEQLKLLRAALGPPAIGATGALLNSEQGLVACGGGTTLRLVEVQPAGKRAMPWSAFAAGHRPSVGEILASGAPPC